MRQEQEAASSEIIEVAPSILRLQLPIEFTGLGHVNTYALEDERGFALVDPGLPGEASWKVLLERLAAADIPLRRVHTVVVTHSHPDHFGGAGMLAEESGAEIWASDRFRTWWDADDLDERPLDDNAVAAIDGVDDDSAPATDLPASPFGRPTPWGGKTEDLPPERKAEIQKNLTEAMRWFRVPRPSVRVPDATRVRLAGREWTGLFTPGHTDDHLCLFDPEHGVVLSGDHVLPTITPHISGLIEGDPLALYVDSLDRVAALEGITVVLPAHGQPFADLPKRVDEIKEHHVERLERMREISQSLGWASVEAVSHELFAERSWGSMAESETYAHLEHLRLTGEAERREEQGLLYYLVA